MVMYTRKEIEKAQMGISRPFALAFLDVDGFQSDGGPKRKVMALTT